MRTPLLIRTLETVPRVSRIEGFHCIPIDNVMPCFRIILNYYELSGLAMPWPVTLILILLCYPCPCTVNLFSESDGSSSYGGGESEDSDWAPPPVAPPTGAAGDDDDDDDIDELLSEAKHFIANKKMRKH